MVALFFPTIFLNGSRKEQSGGRITGVGQGIFRWISRSGRRLR